MSASLVGSEMCIRDRGWGPRELQAFGSSFRRAGVGSVDALVGRLQAAGGAPFPWFARLGEGVWGGPQGGQ
eukprot:12556973-Alexandrium_andersonii.AAC.1